VLQQFHNTNEKKPKMRRANWTAYAAALALIWLPSACSPSPESQRLNSKTLAHATGILDEIASTELALSPETASRLGLDDLATDGATSRLDDHSQAGYERKRLIRLDMLTLVRSRPRMPEEHPIARDLQILEDALSRLTQVQAIGHGHQSLSSVRPYAIDPYRGVWIEGPSLLENDHRVETREDALAYLARLQALPDAIDDTRRRLIADTEAGLTPPAAMLIETRRAVDELIDIETGNLDLLDRTFASILQSMPEMEAEEINHLSAQSTDTIRDTLRPAYTRLSDTLAEIAINAPVHGGLWAQPNGHITYQRLLSWYVNEVQPLDDLHQANMEDMRERQTEFENSLIEIEIESEEIRSIADRLTSLITETEANLLALAEAEPAPAPTTTMTRPLSPIAFTGHAFLRARLDGGRPATATLQRGQLDLWPNYMHAALQLEEDIALRQPFANMGTQRRSPARALATYPSFLETWQFYTAETYSADHLETRPDQIGQQQLFLLYAAMAAADTGLHHKRWSLEQTTDFLAEETYLPRPLMREASLRIAANPGHAAARLYGYRRLKSLQNRARAVLGGGYDEASFQSILLTDGPRPFTMVEADIERWYQSKLPPAN